MQKEKEMGKEVPNESMRFLNPRKIEVEVQKLDGSTAHLVCEAITSEMTDAVGRAAAQAERDPGKALCTQMSTFFGGKREDYEWYDTRVLMQVIRWMTEQIRNPT